MCYTTWPTGKEWLGQGRQLEQPVQYRGEWLGKVELRQAFLGLVKG